MCRLYSESSETVMHLSSGCPMSAKWKYRIRHDIVGKQIHWLLLKKSRILARNEWYSHVPNVVTERDGDKVTFYWDKPIKTDWQVSYNRPDVVVIDREENTWYSGDFAIPIDHHVTENSEENIDKYMDFEAEARTQFKLKTVIVQIVLELWGQFQQNYQNHSNN